jgi:3-hydroxybutyrate dehydrogenase
VSRKPRLQPKHALVTGAAGAIGAAIARSLRAAWPDVALALLDRDALPLERIARELGGACSTHVVDLRDVDALPAAVSTIERERGAPLDGLVNCAGVMRVQGLATWKWDDARDLVAIDLLAPLRLQDLVARGLVERGQPGFVVNVASMAGKVPLKGCAYYGASKAGIAMASEIARADLAPHGVRVVTVYPGPVKSALEQGARDDYGGAGFAGKLAPTGDPAELADKIVRAIGRDEARVIYPRAYAVGFTAPNLSRWIALSYGPPPVR